MRVLGIDPSLTATGLAIVADGELAWHHVIKTSSDESEGGRLARIAAMLNETLHTYYDMLDEVAIEGYAMGAKFNRESMGQVGGVIKMKLFEHGYEPAIWPPHAWRKVVLGNAKLAKDMVRIETYKRFGVDIADHNALEAYCVAMAEVMAQTGAKRPRPKKRKPVQEEAA